MGVNAPPRPAPRRSVPQQPRAAGTLSLVPPRAELRGRAGPGRTPGSRTRPPGPAGGGIGRAPAWAQPPWSSGRRSFGSWRGAPWGGCTGELGGVPGRGRVRMPPFHPGVDGQREKREDTLAWCGEAHPAVQDSVLWMLSSILPGPLSLSPANPPVCTSPHLGLFSLRLCIPPYSLGPCPPVFCLFTLDLSPLSGFLFPSPLGLCPLLLTRSHWAQS